MSTNFRFSINMLSSAEFTNSKFVLIRTGLYELFSFDNFLTLINAFFAASEIAIVSINKHKIKLKADAGDKKAEMLLNKTKEPSRFLSTLQVGTTFAGFFIICISSSKCF